MRFVTLLSIPIVRYKHRVVAVWQDGMLACVTGETDKNGQHEWVRASAPRKASWCSGTRPNDMWRRSRRAAQATGSGGS
jgi:hypothetical protein